MHFCQTWSLYQHISKLLCAGVIAHSNAHFGAGSGPIVLDDVQCTSNSSQLLACPSRPILSHNCVHSTDAGVSCEGMLISLSGCTYKVQYVFVTFAWMFCAEKRTTF